MQIGDCWFDEASGELQHRGRGDSWHLPRAELQVLKLLLANQGRLVSRIELRAGDDNHPPLSDSSVARAVCMLRAFLGPEYESLIETVKGQGYLLRSSVARKPAGVLESRLNAGPKQLLVGLVLIFMLGLSLFYLYRLPRVAPTIPLNKQELTLLSGQRMELFFYSNSRTNNQLLTEQGKVLASALAQCKSSPWRKLYVSLSHDKQVLNLTLRGEYLGQSVVRNLKVSDGRQVKAFVSVPWLKEVDLCG
ncbi:helix-turn-helix domain-containing protein [Shewanella algae]|uniref:winged helix-turn-helix domain-containing protein n=1 Tax=Shewanella algae TaxID=38313 RepID=UPI0031F48A42